MKTGLARGAVIGGGLLALLVVALLVVPVFIDANRYKGLVEDKVQAATGRALTIEGDVSISLLPRPALSVGPTRFANAAGSGEPDMARMESLQIRLSWLPLLRGVIDVARVDLIKPDILLEKDATGHPNWDFIAPGNTDVTPADAAPEAGAAGPGSTGVDIAIGGLRIIDGRVRYADHGTGAVHGVDDLNATFTMAGLNGPFDVEGTFRVRSLPVAVRARTGALAAGRLPFTAKIGFADQPEAVTLTGRINGLDQAPSLTGTVTLSLKQANRAAADIAAALGAPKLALPLAMGAPLSLSADISGDADGGRLENIALSLGTTTIRGRASVNLGPVLKAVVDLGADTIDLDGWSRYPDEAGGPSSPRATGSSSSAPSGGGASAPSGGSSGVSLPTGLDVALTLAVDAALYNGQAVRDIAVAASLDPEGRLTVTNASARLPGVSSLAARGEAITGADGGVAFGLGLSARSDDLRGLLAWLDIDTTAIPPDRLRAFQLSAQASGTPAQIDVSNVAFQLDAVTASGAATVKPGDRLGLGLTVAVDTLPLDAYLPAGGRSSEAAGGPTSPNGPAAKPAPLLAGLESLNSLDAAFDVRVTSLTFKGERFEGLALKGQLMNGALTLTEPTGFGRGPGGTALGAAGTLRGFGGDPLIDTATVTLRAPSAAALFDLAGQAVPDGLPSGDVVVSANVQGSPDRLGIGASAALAGGRITVTGVLADVLSGLPSETTVSFEVGHPEFARFAALLSPGYRPRAATGALAATGTASVFLTPAGTPRRIVLSDLQASVGPHTAAAALDVDMSGAVPGVTGSVALGAFDVDAFLPGGGGASAPAKATGGGGGAVSSRWSKEPLDLSGLGAISADIGFSARSLTVSGFTIEALDTRLTLSDGTLGIPRLNGRLYGGRVDGSFSLATRSANALTLVLDASDMSLQSYLAASGDGKSRVTGSAGLKMDIASRGASVADLVAGLNGSGAVTVRKADVSAFASGGKGDIATGLFKLLSTLNTVGSFGGAGANTVDMAAPFAIAAGVITPIPSMTLSSPLYNAVLTGSVDLPGWRIDTTGEATLSDSLIGGILKKGLKVPETVPFSLKGSLDNPDVSVSFGSLGSGAPKEVLREQIEKQVDKRLEKVLPGAGDVLQHLRGGGGDAGASNNGESPKPSARDAARSLLKGLR